MRQPASPNNVLPLPRDYFQCPELSVDEEERMIQIARMSCRRLIETTYSPNSEWQTVKVKNGVRISKSDRPPLREELSSASDNQHSAANSTYNGTAESASKLTRGSTTVSATIEEIALQFKVDRGQNIMKSRKDVLDSMVLYNLVRPSGARPRDYVGVFWECVKCPVPFSQNRDFLYLECHEEFETPDGRRGWAYSMHSIKLACCPPLESLKLIRANVHNSGFVFIETPKLGELECHYFLDIDVKGTASAIVSDIMSKRKVSALSYLNKVLQEQRLESETLLGDLELPQQYSKIECVLCYKRFTLFNRKYTCRRCGEVVCKSCQATWELDLPGVGVRQICICTLCSANSRGTGNNAETMERIAREVYVPDDDAMSEGGATMVTDISCSISQVYNAQQEADDAYLASLNGRQQKPVMQMAQSMPRRPTVSNKHPSVRPPPPVMMDGDFARTPNRPTHFSTSEDDVISLGSEERFSFHRKRNQARPTSAMPIPLVEEDNNMHYQQQHMSERSPRRLSYDDCADNLVNPTTWKQASSLPRSPLHLANNQPRIEIGSNKRFL
ncbi:Aste57867_8504 [Aphanomyces stellatus]|uniref:Aste57867_8504 protein n=1 Tax=Aphanomyces stellatus TaxID=120398 RepID=A0A485KKI4_9STRA|nr:hypothetical protein As57867_008472 [Aphanomyces stellatus]VFT85390.1 Aste57867_8504 [Aphanomyces stellatus]